MPKVLLSFAQKMPSIARLPSARLCWLRIASPFLYAPSTSAPAYWFELTISMPGFARIAARKPSSRLVVLSLPSAYLSRMTRPRPPRSAASFFAAEPAAGLVVGRDKADVVVALQARVDDHHWNALPHRGADRRDHRRVVEWGEHDAGGAAPDGVFDLGHLRIAVVFSQRAAPRDVDIGQL